MTPEAKAGLNIDALLQQAGWYVCDTNLKRAQALRQATLSKAFFAQ